MSNRKITWLIYAVLFTLTSLFSLKRSVFACKTFYVPNKTCWCGNDCIDTPGECTYTGYTDPNNGLCIYEPKTRKVRGTKGDYWNCTNVLYDWTPDCIGSGNPNDPPPCPPGPCVPYDCVEAGQLPACSTTNNGNTQYTTNKPVDANNNTIENPNDTCTGNSVSCSGHDGCSDCNTETVACYLPETNKSIPRVNRLQIFEDLGIGVPEQPGKNFYWSTPDSIPTQPILIRYPHPNSITATEVDDIRVPQGAEGLRARLKIKAKTQTEESQLGLKVFGVDEPFYSFPNIPNKAWTWFNQNYEGHFSANFETKNKCNDNWITGQKSILQFKVNKAPVLTSTTITGNTVQTDKGCTPAPRYTGNEVNRTLTFNIAARDVDVGNYPNHRINAAVIWLVKEGHSLNNEINTILPLGPNPQHVSLDPNKIGLLVYTNGTHVGLFRYDPRSGWVRKDGGSAQEQNSIYINETKVAEVKAARLASSGNTAGIEVDIEFEKNSPMSGKYTLWAGMMDSLTLFQTQPYGLFVDQRSVTRTNETWNFDFVPPKLQGISLRPISPEDQRRLLLQWNSTDNIPGGIRENHTVVNVYKTGTTPAHPVIREAPSPQQTVQNPHSGEQIPPQEDIGKMQPGTNGMPNSGWFHPNSGQTEMTANVGTNSEGNIHFYITTYDRACNYEQTGKDGTPGINPVELNKWITTKGGVFYSQGTVSYPTDGLDQKHNLGTELISSRTGGLYKVLDYAGTNMNPAVAKRITDVNNNAGLFDALKENFERIKPSLSEAKLISTPFFTALECYDPKGCIYRTNRLAGFFYSGKIIIVPPDGKSDITITRDIKEGFSSTPGDNQGEHALYIFTEGNINIGYPNGSSSGGGTLETDQIDAFLIAKGNINILPEAPEGGFHDKVLVNGGIIALGEVGSSPAFSLQRTLGLLNPNHPVLTANYHPKYAVFSELFFGLQVNAYKREVGFKPM